MLMGQGRATFIGCHFYYPEGPFVHKDLVDPGHPAIYTDRAGMTVSGCDFTGFNRNHIVLGSKSKSTIVSATRFLDGLQLAYQGYGKVETSGNIEDCGTLACRTYCHNACLTN